MAHTPGIIFPKPWHAIPMETDQPNGPWQVVASSLTGDGSLGSPVATWLSEQDAKDIAAGVNKLTADRRMDEESDLHT